MYVSACDCWHVCICIRVCARAYELTSAFFVVVEVALSRGDVGEGGVYVRGAEMGKAKGAELIDNKFCCHLYLCQNTAGEKTTWQTFTWVMRIYDLCSSSKSGSSPLSEIFL